MIVTSLLLSVAAAQSHAPDGAPPHRTFRFVYSAAVPDVPAGAEQVRLWIPVPLSTPDQKIANIELTCNGTGAVIMKTARTPDELGTDLSQGPITIQVRDIQGGFGRSMCVQTPGTAVELQLAFDVTRFETKGGGTASQGELDALRKPNRMIPLNGKVAAIAASMTLPAEPLEVARALYDHTLERMKYDKPEGQAWGRGDAEWACDAKFGNCTDFHSYFMGLARARGLPARFEMGFPIVGGDEKDAKVGGYHCWAYVWIEGHGWLPVDISEADKHPEKADYYFGTLDADRFMMTGGRDLTLTPTPAAGSLNFFVYPYAEIDGQEAKGATKAFRRIDP